MPLYGTLTPDLFGRFALVPIRRTAGEVGPGSTLSFDRVASPYPGCPDVTSPSSCYHMCRAIFEGHGTWFPAVSTDRRLYAYMLPTGQVEVCPVPCYPPLAIPECRAVDPTDPILRGFATEIPTLATRQ